MRVQAMRGGVTRYTFDEIKRKRVVKALCTKCGQKRQRTFTADQTVNPFNKNEDGSVKSPEQVAAAVEAELAALCARPFECVPCWDAGADDRRKAAMAALKARSATAEGAPDKP